MSFAFKTTSGVAGQVRAIALEQVQKALDATEQAADFDETVHSLRRRCKKLRGLLRMVKPHFKDFSAQNAMVRDAADLLGGARDARVMVQTLDALVGDEAGHPGAVQAIAARQFLVARLEQLSQDVDQSEPLQGFAVIFRKLESSIERWKFDERGFTVIGDGLQQTYREFRKLAAEADSNDNPEALHDWRKHSKYHGHHVALLSKAAPDILETRAKSVDRLGDYLGDHHNLAVLGDTLREAKLDETDALERAVADKQHELWQSAISLGRQLAAEKAPALRQRFSGYWQLLPEEN